MDRIFRQPFLIVAATFIIMGFFVTECRAGSGSCQSKSEGKQECMEFIGTLPAMLKSICTLGGGQNKKWVDSPCPHDGVLGFCEVERNDNIRQRVYCYRMAEIPDAQRLEYCRMGCNGSFSASQGGSSDSSGSFGAASLHVAKMPGSAGAAARSKQKAAVTTGASQYVMEQDTNRFGEDYKDMDLDAPDPALCAEACMNEDECKAWTYVKPGVQADNARCWLKDKVPPPSPDDNCISGIKKKRR